MFFFQQGNSYVWADVDVGWMLQGCVKNVMQLRTRYSLAIGCGNYGVKSGSSALQHARSLRESRGGTLTSRTSVTVSGKNQLPPVEQHPHTAMVTRAESEKHRQQHVQAVKGGEVQSILGGRHHIRGGESNTHGNVIADRTGEAAGAAAPFNFKGIKINDVMGAASRIFA